MLRFVFIFIFLAGRAWGVEKREEGEVGGSLFTPLVLSCAFASRHLHPTLQRLCPAARARQVSPRLWLYTRWCEEAWARPSVRCAPTLPLCAPSRALSSLASAPRPALVTPARVCGACLLMSALDHLTDPWGGAFAPPAVHPRAQTPARRFQTHARARRNSHAFRAARLSLSLFPARHTHAGPPPHTPPAVENPSLSQGCLKKKQEEDSLLPRGTRLPSMSTTLSRLAAPFTAVGRWYNGCAQSRPVVTAVITTGLKTSAADLFAQKVRGGEGERLRADGCMARTARARATTGRGAPLFRAPASAPPPTPTQRGPIECSPRSTAPIAPPPPFSHPFFSPLFLQVIEKKEDVDWRRHAVFCTFGICYLGGFQYWLYNIQVHSGGGHGGANGGRGAAGGRKRKSERRIFQPLQPFRALRSPGPAQGPSARPRAPTPRAGASPRGAWRGWAKTGRTRTARAGLSALQPRPLTFHPSLPSSLSHSSPASAPPSPPASATRASPPSKSSSTRASTTRSSIFPSSTP